MGNCAYQVLSVGVHIILRDDQVWAQNQGLLVLRTGYLHLRHHMDDPESLAHFPVRALLTPELALRAHFSSCLTVRGHEKKIMA